MNIGSPHYELRQLLDFSIDIELLAKLSYCMTQDYISYLEKNREDKSQVICDITNYLCQKQDFQPVLEDWRNREKITIERHVWNVFAEAQDAEALNKLNSILDYIIVNSSINGTVQNHKTIISSYEFDDIFTIYRGNCEGIYLKWVLAGKIQHNQSQEKQFYVATLKTLRDDLEAYKIMGEAAGILISFAEKYANKNLSLYKP